MALPAVLAGAMGRAAAGAAGAGAGGSAIGSFFGGAAVSSRLVATLGNVQASFSQVSVAARQATHWTTNLADAVTGRMVKALTLWAGWVQKAAEPIENLVRIHNPAIANKFMLAITDAFGVVGRMLVPVMDAFTTVARKVGNVMAGLEPVFRPAIAAIAKLVEVAGEVFGKGAREWAPVWEMMATAVERVAQAATVLVRVLGEAWRMFGRLTGTIARLLGFRGESFDPNASSAGAAARTARMVQPKDIADEAIKNALMIGREGQTKPKDIGDVWDKLDETLKWAQRRWGQAEAAATAGVGSLTARNIGPESGNDLGAAARMARFILGMRR